MQDVKSRKVRKILKLEAKAATLQARYEAKHEEIIDLRTKVTDLRLNVLQIYYTLTGSEMGELKRLMQEQQSVSQRMEASVVAVVQPK